VSLSVVIPTCNRPDLLTLCLSALAPGTQTVTTRYEVIVTDDGEQPVDALVNDRFPWARWTPGPRRGPAANRNNGARLAGGQWLVFTDDDCQPDAGWLEHYRRAIEAHPQARAFEGAIHPIGDLDRDLAECPSNLTGGWFWSANICVERTLFSELGGFDERFRIAAHEDQDFFLRAGPRTPIPFIADAVVSHPVRYRTLWDSLRRLNQQSLNWAEFAQARARELKYRGAFGIVAAGYRSQLLAAYQAIKKRYPKQFVRATAMLVYGMPLIAFSLASGRIKKSPE